MNCNPLLMIDFYKATHSMMYPKNMTKLVSYLTPRTCRIDDDALVNFGLQGYIKNYIEKPFAEFFAADEEDVVHEYEQVLNATLGPGMYDSEKVRALHKLGYVPLKIKEIPEGTRVPLHCPMISIENTHPDFAWLVNTIESAMSAYLWHPMICAEIGWKYRNIVNKWFEKTVDVDKYPVYRALGDFSFRGQESPEAAITSSAGWLLSHVNTATVPAIVYMCENYNADIQSEQVGFGAVSTEHSVMCSNFAVDGDERVMLKRLLTEIYPKGYFTCVCDSYDYWNVVDNIIPSLKDIILNRDGTFAIRGDSGNPVDITCETVRHLWETFGGTINSKGYKVLDSHVKMVYGDSITVQRCEAIYARLEEMGFAANNVSLGVGSFSMQCIEEDSVLKPFTRDTFGIAVKSTYCEVNGQDIPIFKDPKTDSGIKKSQKGMCVVFRDEQGKIKFEDGYTQNSITEVDNKNIMETLYENGKFAKEYSLSEIRNNLWQDKFFQ